jgi:hypothetical protein
MVVLDAQPIEGRLVQAWNGASNRKGGLIFCAGPMPRPMDSGADWRNLAVEKGPVQGMVI